jgi:hypothetical protein
MASRPPNVGRCHGRSWAALVRGDEGGRPHPLLPKGHALARPEPPAHSSHAALAIVPRGR